MKKLYFLLLFFIIISINGKSQKLTLAEIQSFSKMDLKAVKTYLLTRGYEIFSDFKKEKSETTIDFKYNVTTPFDFSILSFKKILPAKFQVIGELLDTTVFCKMISDSKKQGFNIVNVDVIDDIKNTFEPFAESNNRVLIQMKKGKEEIWVSLNTIHKTIPYISMPAGTSIEERSIKYKYGFVYLINYNINQ